MRRTQRKKNLYTIEGRLYPTKKQKTMLAKTFGCVRVVHNYYVYNFLHPKYIETEETVTLKNGEQRNKRIYEKPITLGNLKKLEEYSYLKEVDSLALCNTKLNMETAKSAFLKEEKHTLKDRIYKKLEKEPDYKPTITDYKGCPRLKSKRDIQSYTTNNLPTVSKKDENKVLNTVELIFSRKHNHKAYIKLPKIGNIKVTLNRYIKEVEICSATISLLESGKYKISILTKNSTVLTISKPSNKSNNEVGIDLGIKSYISDSNGNIVENPKHLRRTERRLKKIQRNLDRKQKAQRSKNYEKYRIKLAKIHEKIKNQRKDFLQKLSTKYVNENQVIYLEDLNIHGMMKNHKLAKSVQECGWASFVSMMEYKAGWKGKEVIKIDRFYPSSKTCSNCGHIMESMPLNVREWICPVCGINHDRDINAARNILTEGQKIKYNNTAGTAGIQACVTTCR